jgi:CorA-like Mg2+ transporter protein
MVGYAVSDERLVDELVGAYASDASKRSTAITDARTFPSLVGLTAHRLDVLVATVWVDRDFEFCLRLVRVFWTDDWLLTIWKPAGGQIFSSSSNSVPSKWDTESDDARSAALPARRRSHLPDDLPTDVGGLAALIRFAYFVAGHHEFSVGVTSETLERWQSTFFEEAGDARGVDPLDLMAPLSDVGRSIVLMRPALQRLRSTFKSAPFRAHAPLSHAADRDADALHDVSGEVRDAYSIAASAANLYQSFQAERKTAADRRLQRVASVIAAVVLWPGLVATLYGANVSGLPGGSKHGLLVVGVASVVGALIILLALLLALRSRDASP